ncbi:hypothetical protein KFL_000380420 [Klebsormidium nitens]|uniref:Uncharacterized protein n=1 Tax=Klebsormidium nitens TaxID=105231 RepID=A0A1Y1HPW1_KLENI|nr:hypothetical protein KFL_000380420 [Klebsormidium nitens]|eukprot:GAQ79812.1 hypothetical protein KFL_000380420 [Klebsormidium nitens]
MVHFSAEAEFQWYCEGRRAGCSKTTDCSHLQEVKRALQRREGVSRLDGRLFSESQLERARLWLHQKASEVAVGKQHAGPTPPQAGEESCADGEAGPQEELEALTDEERYLLGLVAGEQHDAVCKGDVCFCKQHLSLFGGVGLDRQPCEGRCCSPANSSATGKRPRAETENGTFVTGSAQRGVKRRSKTYWAAQPLLEATCDLMWWTLERVETPKLVRPTDGLAVHDPPVTLLKQPVRVSQLVARDFEELSRMAGLCAPCPREPPPCGTGWLSLMQTSHIYSLDWSQEHLRTPPGGTSLRRHRGAGLCRRRAAEGRAGWVQRCAVAAIYGAESRCQGGECCEADGAGGGAAALGGAGLKRRLVHQPELRALIARFSQHHPGDPDLGAKLSNVEFDELLAALDREDVQVAPEFVPNPVDEEADPVLFYERRRLLLDQFAQIRSKNGAMLANLEGIKTEALRASPLRPPRCPPKWAELLYGLGTPQSVSDDSNLIQHKQALAVVRKLLLGGVANLDDKAILAEHAPILGRLLDHFGFGFPRYFTPALHHLYRLTLFGRGAVGLGVGRAGWPLSAIEGLDNCVSAARDFVERPWTRTAERLQAVEFGETRANALLPGVESLTAPSTALYPLRCVVRRIAKYVKYAV